MYSDHCEPPDGSRNSKSSKLMSGMLTTPNGRDAWIRYQRDSLAKIFRLLEKAQASEARGADCSRKLSEPQSRSVRNSSFSKTPPLSEPGGATSFCDRLWRRDIPAATERLRPLMSAQVIEEIGGGALLPTLTVSGNWNRKGASKNSGDGLATSLKRLPSLTASDATKGLGLAKTGTARAAESPNTGARSSINKATKQLLLLSNSVNYATDCRLTPTFAEWWMGWPIGSTSLAIRLE